MLIPGAPLLSIALNANVLATVLLPVTLVFMIMLANDRELMGRVGQRRVGRTGWAVAIVAFIAICGAAYGDRLVPARGARRMSGGERSGADRRRPHQPPTAPQEWRPVEYDEDGLIDGLEPDQLAEVAARPVPPARLGPRARAALWALRTSPWSWA